MLQYPDEKKIGRCAVPSVAFLSDPCIICSLRGPGKGVFHAIDLVVGSSIPFLRTLHSIQYA